MATYIVSNQKFTSGDLPDPTSAIDHVKSLDIYGLDLDDFEVIVRANGLIQEIRIYLPSRDETKTVYNRLEIQDADNDATLDFDESVEVSPDTSYTDKYKLRYYRAIHLEEHAGFTQDWYRDTLLPAFGNDHGLQFFIE